MQVQKKGENIGNSIINPIYLFRNRKFSLILIVNDIQQTKTSTNISFVFDYSTTNIQGEMKGKLQYIFHRFSDFLVCFFVLFEKQISTLHCNIEICNFISTGFTRNNTQTMI